MPELPEVEVVKREINKSLENRIIKRFDIRFPKLREEVSKELYSLENLTTSDFVEDILKCYKNRHGSIDLLKESHFD